MLIYLVCKLNNRILALMCKSVRREILFNGGRYFNLGVKREGQFHTIGTFEIVSYQKGAEIFNSI